jgi:hypothetical protein
MGKGKKKPAAKKEVSKIWHDKLNFIIIGSRKCITKRRGW